MRGAIFPVPLETQTACGDVGELLVARGVHFAHKSGFSIRGINLDASEGELVGLVGPNGAGKTTLLRLLSGSLTPSRGTIEISGVDIGSLNASERAKLVSVVPQNPQLPLTFSVLNLVLMGRNAHLKLLQWESLRDIEIARKVMEMTDIWRFRDREIESLSGGERQRVVVALALAQQAPVMIMDEPTASLDLGHQAGIMDLVRNLQHQGDGAIVLAMHDLTLAAQYCDRLVMVTDGRVFVQGKPKAVLTTEIISEAYGAEVQILSDPRSGNPVVVPVAVNDVAGNTHRPSW